MAPSMGAMMIASQEEVVSKESEQLDFEMVPPIILNEDADVVAYPSVEALIRDVELVDVLDQEYEFHDSTGRVLEARVDKKRVSLVPTSRVEADSAVLRGYILQVLRLRGVHEEGLSSAPFGDLARLLLEKLRKKRKK
jgi:hypothetical protein